MQLSKIVSDAMGITRVCGPWVALRWLAAIGGNLFAVLKSRNLQPADQALGEGPFRVIHGSATASLVGEKVMSGIREIWVRDVYLKDGLLKIPANATVVDLGANRGNFTTLALAHGDGVRTISVEPSKELGAACLRQIAHNQWEHRAKLHRGFIGPQTEIQLELLQSADFEGAPLLSEAEFVDQYEIDTIDFLKCDIEGSEFGLLTKDSLLLQRAQQLAIELHDFAGDRYEFMGMLEQCGFEIASVTHNATDCIVLARRTSVQSSSSDASTAAVAGGVATQG